MVTESVKDCSFESDFIIIIIKGEIHPFFDFSNFLRLFKIVFQSFLFYIYYCRLDIPLTKHFPYSFLYG